MVARPPRQTVRQDLAPVDASQLERRLEGVAQRIDRGGGAFGDATRQLDEPVDPEVPVAIRVRELVRRGAVVETDQIGRRRSTSTGPPPLPGSGAADVHHHLVAAFGADPGTTLYSMSLGDLQSLFATET